MSQSHTSASAALRLAMVKISGRIGTAPEVWAQGPDHDDDDNRHWLADTRHILVSQFASLHHIFTHLLTGSIACSGRDTCHNPVSPDRSRQCIPSRSQP